MRGQQTEADRIAELERDPQCSQFDAHRCLCAACGRWVHLSGRAHKIFNWRRHKKGCTLQKARGAITIIQSKSPQQRTGGEDYDDGIRMDVDDDLDMDKSVYAHSDDGYYDAPPSPNTSHSSISVKSGIYNPRERSNDKRYLQLPSITTFALSPTGSTSTPPLTSSDAASCSTATSDSGHSLISSWSQSQANLKAQSQASQQPYVSGPIQSESWGRASHRPRGASTSSFRSLPPLSATSSASTTTASPKIHYKPRGGPIQYFSCDGCQTRLDHQEWTLHKRSCKAYIRLQHQTEKSHGYHHHHSYSQPTNTLLPPMITTTSPTSDGTHVNLLNPSISRRTISDAGYGGSKMAYKQRGGGGGDASQQVHGSVQTYSAHSTTHSHHLPLRHSSPPRLSVDTSFFSSGIHDPAARGREVNSTLTAHGVRSHRVLYEGRPSHESGYESPHVQLQSEGRLMDVQSRVVGNKVSLGTENGYPDGFRSDSRASVSSGANHSPTSSKGSSGRSSLKISDLCHPSPPRSPDSDREVTRTYLRSSSGSPRSGLDGARVRSRSPSWSKNGYRMTEPYYRRHPSSEDNSTTPTHTPHLKTSVHSVLSKAGIYRPTTTGTPFHHLTSLGSDIRPVQYSYSQSRSTFQSEPDSLPVSDTDYDSEDEREVRTRRIGRSSTRSLSPPSPYISDA